MKVRHSKQMLVAVTVLCALGGARAQSGYVPQDDPSRYRYAGETDAQYESRVRQYRQRQGDYYRWQDQQRRQSPGPNMPSMQQQQSDQEQAVRDGYARQKESTLTRLPASRSGAPRAIGR